MQPTPDPRPVLVAVDPSDSARDAAVWAAEVAADWSVPLHLLHVVPGRSTDPPLPPPRWLQQLDALAVHTGVPDRVHEVVQGNVVEIVSARARDARMVVLGSYGDTGWSGGLSGPVSIAVVGRVQCPVAVGRGPAPRVAPPRGGPVVVGVDGSAAGAAALGFGAGLAADLGTSLVAVHAWSGDADDGCAAAWRLLATSIADVRRAHPLLPIDQVVEQDTPLRVLYRRAEGARMLVLGNRGWSAPERTPLSETTRSLVESAPCPVVVLHAAVPAAVPVGTHSGPARCPQA